MQCVSFPPPPGESREGGKPDGRASPGRLPTPAAFPGSIFLTTKENCKDAHKKTAGKLCADSAPREGITREFSCLGRPVSSWLSAEASAVTSRDRRDGRCPGLDVTAGRGSPLSPPLGQEWEGTRVGPGAFGGQCFHHRRLSGRSCGQGHGQSDHSGGLRADCPWQSW